MDGIKTAFKTVREAQLEYGNQMNLINPKYRELLEAAIVLADYASQQEAEIGRPDSESEWCCECKEEFGHPDNCIGCDGPPAD